MAKTKSSGKPSRGKPSRKLTGDPPIIIGGGSVRVFFKSNATEVIPSPREGYRCFRLPGNIKNISFFDGENPGVKNLEVKNSNTFFTQADE